MQKWDNGGLKTHSDPWQTTPFVTQSDLTWVLSSGSGWLFTNPEVESEGFSIVKRVKIWSPNGEIVIGISEPTHAPK